MKSLFPLTPHLHLLKLFGTVLQVRICDTCLDLIPTKFSSPNLKHPWINTYIKCLSRRKQHAYNQAFSSNEPQHWTRYYDLKRECQQECCIAYNKYVSNLVNLNKNIVTNKLWTYIKSKRQDNIGSVAMSFRFSR